MKPLALALSLLAVAGCADPATTADPIRVESDIVDDGPAPDAVEDGAILGDGIQEDDGTLLDEDAADRGGLDGDQ